MNKIKSVGTLALACVFAYSSFQTGQVLTSSWPIATLLGAIVVLLGNLPVLALALILWCIFDFVFRSKL